MWFIRPPEESPCDAIWLLEGGHSEDGMGQGDPLGYTADREVALKHWKAIRNQPYSKGRVIEVWPYQGE